MICWKVSHKYKLIDHIERKDIGIFSTVENAEQAVALLKTKSGFIDTVDGFRITKVFRLFKPRFLIIHIGLTGLKHIHTNVIG